MAGALAEYTLRRGVEKTIAFNGRLVFALSDDTNTEKPASVISQGLDFG